METEIKTKPRTKTSIAMLLITVVVGAISAAIFIFSYLGTIEEISNTTSSPMVKPPAQESVE